MIETERVVLASRPHGEPRAEDFRFETAVVPAVQDGEVLLRTLYLSLDPYMRGRLSEGDSYIDPIAVGGVMEGGTVNEVVESCSDRFSPGDLVLGFGGWQTYSVVAATGVRPLTDWPAPPSTALGVLGMPGFTAWAGLQVIGKPRAGETLVVAAATGPVGSAVGQIAQLRGARAVGIAGGPQKCAHLLELGFDAAIDHRSPTFVDDLVAATPDGIDVYFENVGGAVWDVVRPRLNVHARVPVCGVVAHYNDTEAPSGPDQLPGFMMDLVSRRITVQGFIQQDFVREHYKSFLAEATPWVLDGTLKYREDVVDGLAAAPGALIGLLRGENFGKVVVDLTGSAS